MRITKDTTLSTIKQLAPACGCHACVHGCTMGSGILVGDDTKVLARHLGLSEKELISRHLEPVEQFNRRFHRPRLLRNGDKPYGRCVFLDRKGSCTIHDSKPLQCKISMGCKPYGADLSAWFLLNHLLDPHDPEALRQFKSYLDAGGKTLPGGSWSQLVGSKKKRDAILSYQER